MTPQIAVEPRPRTVRVLAAAVALAAGLTVLLVTATAFAATYDPLDIISEDNWRASSSLSQADIQAFLETRPGVLKSYVTTNYAGVMMPASRMIAEASVAWNVSPKAVIATIQKEQSLIDNPAPRRYAFDWAMGCGKADTGTNYAYMGFGKQIWFGAQKLGATTGSYAWYPGKPKRVHMGQDPITHVDLYAYIIPKNQPTWNLYTYTPHYPQVSFYNLYVKYFGDTHTLPRVKPVYQFLGRRTGAYLYTTSEAERYHLIAAHSSTWRFQGVSFAVDTSATTNVAPLYRLYNKRTGRYVLTASEAEKVKLLRLKYRRRAYYRLDGVAAFVALDPTGATPVYRLFNTRKNTYYLTASYAQFRALAAQRRAGWRSKGVAFYLGAYVPPVPPAPPATPPAG